MERIRRGIRLRMLRFLRLKDSNERIARGFAVGLIINFIPTFGFGVLISGLAAKLVGGNGIAGLMGGALLVFFFPLLFSLDLLVGRWAMQFPALNGTANVAADPSSSTWGRILFFGTLANCLSFGLLSYGLTRITLPLLRPWALRQLRSRPGSAQNRPASY